MIRLDASVWTKMAEFATLPKKGDNILMIGAEPNGDIISTTGHIVEDIMHSSALAPYTHWMYMPKLPDDII